MIRPFDTLFPFRHFDRRGVYDLPVLDLNFLKETLDPRITFTRSGTATRINSSGALETVSANTPRFDYDPANVGLSRGLLIEESRVNSIRNSTMQGVVAGSPGTAPTNWAVSGTGSGLTRTIVGSGVVGGMSYIDIRYQFSGAGLTANITFEASNQIAATTGQTWTNTFYVSLQGGATTNLTVRNSLAEANSSGAFITNSVLSFVPTSDPVQTQRNSLTRTGLNGAGVAFVYSAVQIVSTGAADITLRIAAPQLEQGAFATSFIPTTNAAVTRNADSAVMTGTNFSSWYNASEGTLFAEGSWMGDSVTDYYFAISDGTSANIIGLRTAVTTSHRFVVIAGSTTEATIAAAAPTAGVIFRHAGAYKANDVTGALNGTLGALDSAATMPISMTQALFSASAGTTNQFNGYLRRIGYFNRRLSNQELMELTA